VSQLQLALQAGVSQRHLSFVEIGRANPSRELVLRLSAELGLALRDRNALLLAAGYAPAYPETPFRRKSSARSGTRWRRSSPAMNRSRPSLSIAASTWCGRISQPG
jgi:transcriptional regulator with XRE-family HTH domain